MTTAMRTPAITTGIASGISTRCNLWMGVIPNPPAASRKAGSTLDVRNIYTIIKHPAIAFVIQWIPLELHNALVQVPTISKNKLNIMLNKSNVEWVMNILKTFQAATKYYVQHSQTNRIEKRSIIEEFGLLHCHKYMELVILYWNEFPKYFQNNTMKVENVWG